MPPTRSSVWRNIYAEARTSLSTAPTYPYRQRSWSSDIAVGSVTESSQLAKWKIGSLELPTSGQRHCHRGNGSRDHGIVSIDTISANSPSDFQRNYLDGVVTEVEHLVRQMIRYGSKIRLASKDIERLRFLCSGREPPPIQTVAELNSFVEAQLRIQPEITAEERLLKYMLACQRQAPTGQCIEWPLGRHVRQPSATRRVIAVVKQDPRSGP